jgi:hypothetical protein
MDSFRVLSPHEVAYLDVTGSGAETAAHLKASPDSRLTLMFCAFDGAPMILRLYGRGHAFHRRTAGYETMIDRFIELPGTRQIIHLTIDLVQTSCGMAVPLFDYTAERDNLNRWARRQGHNGLQKYQSTKNVVSIDGFPTGFDPATMNKPDPEPVPE